MKQKEFFFSEDGKYFVNYDDFDAKLKIFYKNKWKKRETAFA